MGRAASDRRTSARMRAGPSALDAACPIGRTRRIVQVSGRQRRGRVETCLMPDDFVLLPFSASATLVYRLVLEHIPVDTLAIIGPDACEELLQELESGDVLEEWVEELSQQHHRPVV